MWVILQGFRHPDGLLTTESVVKGEMHGTGGLPQRRHLRRGPAPHRPGRGRGGRPDPGGGRRGRPRRSPGATEVDLAGGLLLPGFVDAHVHPVQGGLERVRCDLSEGRTREDYLRTVREYAADHPDLPWILGGGWAMAAFPGGTPTAADLDAVVPDRPVFLPNRDHHGAWVNTPGPGDRGHRRGHPRPAARPLRARTRTVGPTGTLHEGAMVVVSRHCPPTSDEENYRGPARGPALPALARRDRLAGRHPR